MEVFTRMKLEQHRHRSGGQHLELTRTYLDAVVIETFDVVPVNRIKKKLAAEFSIVIR